MYYRLFCVFFLLFFTFGCFTPIAPYNSDADLFHVGAVFTFDNGTDTKKEIEISPEDLLGEKVAVKIDPNSTLEKIQIINYSNENTINYGPVVAEATYYCSNIPNIIAKVSGTEVEPNTLYHVTIDPTDKCFIDFTLSRTYKSTNHIVKHKVPATISIASKD